MDNPFAPELLIEERGPVRLVTLNRPEALNATNEALHHALVRVWRHLAEDPGARAVVLTGAGRAFSAGGDFQHFVELWEDRELRRAEIDGARRLLNEMVDFPLPVVAAVNGAAVGLGCNLAVCSDIVLLAESAFISDPHVGVGLTAADGGAPTWPLLMGMLRAKEYLLTSERIPAHQAVSLGLANRVVPDAELLDEALKVADKLAAQPPQAVQSTKRALNMHIKRAVAGVLEYALGEEFASFDTPEHQALVRSFLERSKARAAAAGRPS
ncbi:enoyl-CoA hydratase/carnithine racemase [Frankia torreyi]|uniref:Enoyl-CoA hydratase/carnithine racemase n=2 Tax=Frankia TaxID=1854 RepID=A0A0D8BEV6_9ACTN|nr:MULTISPECIES: enoyl-CoA hydratase-related protein [Frankia]KJE22519.1 enoyl-CoA hydratase/carnithine racemase [Frankia torreyi]KQC38283.1 enoyl-CoA hydratase [Frankia sp. ACN1ag]KQM04558.1 enoyl-CoA hydratase/carnithine racemase [Frankia sp. CpI1-P]